MGNSQYGSRDGNMKWEMINWKLSMENSCREIVNREIVNTEVVMGGKENKLMMIPLPPIV